MKRTIWKSTFREIRQSFGRFFAILAIVALGVAFFAGLKATKPAMVKTTGAYLQEQEFYDYRILSTLGFEQEEVEFLQGKEEVRSVEGAVSFDILYLDEATGNEGVLKAHSITDLVNKTVLLHGRMPQNANECVVDADLFAEDSIGKVIRLSGNNEEEDLEKFAYNEYTIVGIVQSPLYIQFERGNTSLGAGKLSGFFYIPYEGFDVDYYTEIYVKFDKDFALYSEEYKAYLDEKEAVWESYAKEAAMQRYERIVTEANDELAEAKAEFETEKADAQEELQEAAEQLKDAKVQLADGEKQLAEAKEDLAEAKQTLADKEKELADGEKELTDSEAEFADGEKKLQEGITVWKENKSKLEASKVEIENGLNQLDLQLQELQKQEEELFAGESTLLESEHLITEQQVQLLAQKEELEAQEQALNALYGEGNVPSEMFVQIQAGKQQIAEGMQQIEDGFRQIEANKKELEAGKKAISDAKQTIGVYQSQLYTAQQQLIAGEQALSEAWKEIEANKKKIAEGKTALQDAKEELADGKLQIADAKKELAEGEETLAEKEQEFADAQVEYADGKKEYEDGLAEFEEKIADAEQKIVDAEEEIADLEEPESYLLGRDTNVGYVCFENDSSIIEGIANVFPVFFFLVAALVCITTMNRMVEEQRTQIGVLKALGYSESMIMTKYMFYSGSAAIVGCLIGYFGGSVLFPSVIWYAYGIMYRVDKLQYVFLLSLAIISIVVSVLCSMGATWLSCRVELSQVAAQLMRPKSPKVGKRVFLEYFPFIWKRLGFLKKVSIRNIFRYKKRLFMMVLGISGCTALLVTGYGVKDSIANVATQQFDEIQIYDISVVFADAVTEEKLTELEEVAGVTGDAYIPTYETSYDLVTEQGRKSVNLMVFDSEANIAPFLNLHTKEKEQIAYPAVGEVVITDKIAENFNLQVGDTITLQNEDMQTITVKISGINQNFIYNYAYINSETYESVVGTMVEYKNLLLNVPEGEDVHRMAAALMKVEDVASVTVNRDTAARLNSMMASLDLIIVVIILCAGGLAFIVLYNLTNINITERIREIATIKVLGFHKKETASYVFRENMVLAGMGIVVGMVLGHYLHLFVMNEVQIDLITFDIHVRPISYLYSVLLTFAFAWIINRIMGRKLEQISMTESLKSVD